MAVDLRMSVEKQIAQLKKAVSQKSSELNSMQNELKKHEQVYELLSGEKPQKRVPKKRARAGKRLDWGAVLKGLPGTFDVASMTKMPVLRGKAKSYLRMVVIRWVKEGRVKRVSRGKYRSV